MNRFINWLSAFAFGDEKQETGDSFIHMSSQDLETRVRFNNDEDIFCEIKRINGRIELKFERMEELK